MKKNKIVAFLQNQWFKNPARVEASIAAQPEATREGYRQRFAQRALFAGCLTGQRLLKAFGSELCNQIFWENASREMGTMSNAAFKADLDHIRRVLEQQEPKIVLAFGKIATDALIDLVPSDNLIIGPHPASRQPDILPALIRMKHELEQRIALADFT